MPTPATRTCPSCLRDKPTGSGFRDPGDVTTGRPPKICYECRAKSPALRARQAQNAARRPENRAQHHAYASMTPGQRAAFIRKYRPHGLKECPEGAGCGRALPLSEFRPDQYQPDGRASRCNACQ